jgi:hypothetical protein
MGQRNAVIPVRLTEAERFIYADAAERLKMSMSGLMREGALRLIHHELLTKKEPQKEEVSKNA